MKVKQLDMQQKFQIIYQKDQNLSKQITHYGQKNGENKVTTRALEGTLLNPGESATVEIIFTWKNDETNLGLKTNIAEISEDYNEKGAKDIDSTPDNQIPIEDDQDLALVILTIRTGSGTTYIGITVISLIILAGGIYLIKRYVI